MPSRNVQNFNVSAHALPGRGGRKRPGFVLLLALLAPVAHVSGQSTPPASSSVTSGPDGGAAVSASFHSATLGRAIDYLVALPAGYAETGTQRYPVLYLLHGRGDTMQAWAAIAPELHRLTAEGRIPPVIAIMPDAPASRRAGYYIDSRFTGSAHLPAGEAMETALCADLLPHVDRTYRTQANRTGRIAAGYSMGGYGAMRLALAHPELFGAAIVLSPAVYHPLPPAGSSTREFGAFGDGAGQFSEQVYRSLNYPALLPSFTAKNLPLPVFIAVGDDEFAHPDPAEAVHDLDYEAHTLYNHLRRTKGIAAQLRVVDGGHNWKTWRPTFIEGVTYIFGQLKSAPSPAR